MTDCGEWSSVVVLLSIFMCMTKDDRGLYLPARVVILVPVIRRYYPLINFL